jgi:hypothetical protein
MDHLDERSQKIMTVSKIPTPKKLQWILKRMSPGADKTYPSANLRGVSRNTSGRNLKLSVAAGEGTNNTVMLGASEPSSPLLGSA